MSYIAFTSPKREVRVSGRERASLSNLCARWLLMQLNVLRYDELDDFVRETMPSYYHGTDNKFLRDRIETHCSVGENFYLAGKEYPVFDMQLNSVLTDGNRAAQFAAKLHGQCEIHAYVEGSDRAWLADVVDEGMEAGIFRPLQGWEIGKHNALGWEAVAIMLREDDNEPVVTSYSVTESFPGTHMMPDDWPGHKLIDPWEAMEELNHQQIWDMCMSTLRNRGGMRFAPDTLARRFYDGMNGRQFARAFDEHIAERKQIAEREKADNE